MTNLCTYLTMNSLMLKYQSAYQKGHTTETAFLCIYNDIVDAITNGQLALLCLLDLSVALDTVDHDILVQCLELTYGLNGVALFWLRDYLTDRSHLVCWKNHMSVTHHVLSEGAARIGTWPITVHSICG